MVTKTATLDINVTKFRPVGIVPTSATFKMITLDPEYFHTDGTNIWITIPKNAPKDLDIEVVFQADAALYHLVGIAFNKTDFDPNSEGRAEFPLVTISGHKDPITPLNSISRMRVKDALIKDKMGVNYDYYIMIQEASSGQVGVIDPPISTDPE